MTWTLEYDRDALKALKKLDKTVASKILNYLDSVAALDDLRTHGKSLTGNLAGLWRYRIGDYRVICDLHDDQFIVIALDMGHRSGVYG